MEIARSDLLRTYVIWSKPSHASELAKKNSLLAHGLPRLDDLLQTLVPPELGHVLQLAQPAQPRRMTGSKGIEMFVCRKTVATAGT
jgi:hypothetical protein